MSAITLLGAGCGTNLFSGRSNEPADPAITVSDQNLSDSNEIVISKASLPEDGWISIHTRTNGQTGPVIGYTALKTGTESDIKITVDRTKVTPSLLAMLHYDRDPKGTYEYPGSDGPVIKDQQVVMKEFAITNQGTIEQENLQATTSAR